jgi:hypothetical protein
VDDNLERIWKEVVVAYPNIYVKVGRKPRKILFRMANVQVDIGSW